MNKIDEKVEQMKKRGVFVSGCAGKAATPMPSNGMQPTSGPSSERKMGNAIEYIAGDGSRSRN